MDRKRRMGKGFLMTVMLLVLMMKLSLLTIGGDPLVDYSLDGYCDCSRQVRSLNGYDMSLSVDKIDFTSVHPGDFVGRSSCNTYTTALGAGQRVLSYSYYTPPVNTAGEPRERGASLARYTELLKDLLYKTKILYPDWRVRIYHNISKSDTSNRKLLCNMYCNNDHLDLCDVTSTHSDGDMNKKFPVGRFWRFMVSGDPTVEVFGSRDVDSYIQDREVFAVREFLNSTKQFHVMRDGPFHGITILAGLWGGKNYQDMMTARRVRNNLLSVKPTDDKSLDQNVLHKKIWPLIRDKTMVHDSYYCKRKDMSGGDGYRPWPSRRVGYAYVGYGPTKDAPMDIIKRTPCPVGCRPKDHKDWEYC